MPNEGQDITSFKLAATNVISGTNNSASARESIFRRMRSTTLTSRKGIIKKLRKQLKQQKREESSTPDNPEETPPGYFREFSPWENPYNHAIGPKNIQTICINGHDTLALLDSGSQVNLITPALVEERSIEPLPMKHYFQMTGKDVILSGVGGSRVFPIGHVVLRIKHHDYEEDSIAFIVEDDSKLGRKIPVVLGTSTLERMAAIQKESTKLDEQTQLVSDSMMGCRKATITAEDDVKTVESLKESSENKKTMLVSTASETQIPGFSKLIIKARLNSLANEEGKRQLVAITPTGRDGEYPLPRGLECISSTYDVPTGSKKIRVMLKNTTGQTIRLGQHVVIAESVPIENEEGMDENAQFQKILESKPYDGPTRPVLTVPERQDKLETDLVLDGIPEDRKKKLLHVLKQNHKAFAIEKLEMGCVNIVKHKIQLLEGSLPHKERYRNIPTHMLDEVRKHLDELIVNKTIQPSKSPWCNAVVLVRKKDGELRFCIDFRKLNGKTRKDAYPLPRINDALNAMRGSKYFSCLDLKRGFYQTEMDPESRQYTAFTAGNMGFFEFRQMPFGLCNAPATFQRLMEECLGELIYSICVVYLDDIIIFAKTEDEHLHRLGLVMERLQNANLKLKPAKCEFFKDEIEYLGHKVTEGGIHPMKKNLESVAKFAEPGNVTQVKSFLGLVGHYRRFIKDFAKIAKPLHELTKKQEAGTQSRKMKSPPVELNEKAKAAFYELKDKCLRSPVLIYADITKPFLLETDASKVALGAVLSQEQNGAFHPVAYASRILHDAETRYHSSKQEFLALKWAITEQFAEYLIHLPFTVRTDNNPLTYVMTTPNLDATGHRWVAALASFRFKLEYLKGANNGAADALSRLPEEASLSPAETEKVLADKPANMAGKTLEKVPFEEVEAMMDAAKSGCINRSDLAHPNFELLLQETEDRILEESKKEETLTKSGLVEAECNMLTVRRDFWRQLQENDPYVKATLEWLEEKKKKKLQDYLKEIKNTEEGVSMRREQKKFVIKDSLLYKGSEENKKSPDYFLQLVVPKGKYRDLAIKGCHDQAGHQGIARTKSLLADRFWWPGMLLKAEEVVKGCITCIKHQGKKVRAMMTPNFITNPGELLHVDFTSVESNLNPKEQTKSINILVVSDHFTRHAMAFLTPDQEAATVARVLWKGYFSIFGLPQRMMSDRGTNFTAGIIKELSNLLGIDRVLTSPYHPQTNGQVERLNRTIFGLIGKMSDEQKVEWSQHLHALIHAYNCTRSAITGYSPYFLMFGRRPRMPVDLHFPVIPGGKAEKVNEYVLKLEKRLKLAIELARSHAHSEAMRQKGYYDRTANASKLRKGDKVMVSLTAFRGRRKAVNKWDGKVHEVLGTGSEGSNVYRVKVGNETKYLHRNRLYKLDPLPDKASDPVAARKLKEVSTLDSPTNEEDIQIACLWAAG